MSLRRGMMAATTAPTTDPYWSNVVSLLHFDGADGSTTLADETGKTWTATGSPTIRAAESKFGGASLELLSSPENRIDCSHSDFNFGASDYTIECWVRPDATSNRSVFSFGTRLVYVASNQWAYFNGANRIVGGTVSTSAFTHIALCRASGTTRLFINGVPIGTGYTGDSGVAINPGTMRIGYFNSGNPSGRYYDEFRVTKGVARYTSSFTPPTSAFPNS